MRPFKVLVSFFALIYFGVFCSAEMERSPHPLRVLLTYQGHDFEENKFFAMWDDWQKQGLITYERCPLPDKADVIQPAALEAFDVIVMYDMVAGLSPAQQASFVALLEKGIGVVSLHHNLVAHENWMVWRKIIGGKFVRRDEVIDGKTYPASVYEHDVWMKICIPDPKHPIVKGIEPFFIYDESYGKIYHESGLKVILTTDRAGSDPEIAWTTRAGRSPVFYFQLGHASTGWSHPSYQQILLRGMRWAADEAKVLSKP